MSDLKAYSVKEAALLTCGGCATFAHGWMGRDWNCRRGERNTNADSPACPKWAERQPEPEPDVEAMRGTAAMLDEIFKGVSFEPEPARKKERPPGLRGHYGGVVYFVDCGEYTKVGHTGGWVGERMKGIETHNPFELKLWGLIVGDRETESAFHEILAQHRHRNEWFRLNRDTKQRIADLLTSNGGEVYD